MSFAGRGENVTDETRDGGMVISYERVGKFLAVAFRGKAAKPAWHYTFRSTEARQQYIAAFWESLAKCQDYKAQRQEQRKADAAKMREQIRVGTILSGSWGYDQTNAEIWQVTAVQGAFAWVRPLACETVPGSEGYMSEMIKPIPGKFCGDAVKKLIGACGLSFDHFTLSPCSADSHHYSSHYA